MKTSSLIPVQSIEKAIYLIRGEKVILDRDLAELYEVDTRVLNQAVGRNRDRFPSDFMFELTREEIDGITSCDILVSRPSQSVANRTNKRCTHAQITRVEERIGTVTPSLPSLSPHELQEFRWSVRDSVRVTSRRDQRCRRE